MSLSEELVKEMYRSKFPNGAVESYMESNGKGYTNFKQNANLVANHLLQAGWVQSERLQHDSEEDVILFKFNGDSIILKDKGIQIEFKDGHWKWFSMGSFMRHLNKYRELMKKVNELSSFFQRNTDEW